MNTPQDSLSDSKTTPQFHFGQKVKVLGTLYREEHGPKRYWNQCVLKKPIIGIVIRKTTLSNGRTGLTNDDWMPVYYRPEYYFVAYEVAYSLNRKTVLVRADDLQAVE